MCFFPKQEVYIMGVKMPGEEKGVTLRLALTEDGKRYEDYFTLERPIQGGGREVVLKIPFSEIIDVTYDRPFSGDLCTIRFTLRTYDERVTDLKVKKMNFNAMDLKKMIRLWRKSASL